MTIKTKGDEIIENYDNALASLEKLRFSSHDASDIAQIIEPLQACNLWSNQVNCAI